MKTLSDRFAVLTVVVATLLAANAFFPLPRAHAGGSEGIVDIDEEGGSEDEVIGDDGDEGPSQDM